MVSGLFFFFLAVLGLHCCTRAFSSCSEWGLLFVAVRGLLIAVASLVVEHGLQELGLQQLWLRSSRVQAQQLWHTGLVAPWLVGSSQTRARTYVPCIGRRILNHCATREVPQVLYLSLFYIIFIGVQLIYNVVLVSGVQQSESAIHIHISTLFQILFPYRSLQSIEQSSLCYAVGPYQLSILYIVARIYQSQSPNLSLPPI